MEEFQEKKELIKVITLEAESLGIPVAKCEDLWPATFLVKQHWTNKAQYNKSERKRRRMIARENAKKTTIIADKDRGDLVRAINVVSIVSTNSFNFLLH